MATLLDRLRFFMTLSGGVYAAIIALLAKGYNSALYLNAIKLPLFADFNLPESYGLARECPDFPLPACLIDLGKHTANKTLNLHIKTADNETLGAWFILSDQYYQSLPEIPSKLENHVPLALQRHPTVLFFHGNAATRALNARVQHYQAYSSRLAANVLAIDYRGFADSTGSPSEQGLVTDARAAWDWLVQKGAKENDILIVGHSLGTGVTSQLAAELSDEGIKPRGTVLLSPFSSIREVLNTYQFFGLIPLMKPLAMLPYIPDLITKVLIHKFDSLGAVPRIKGSVLIAHAENDWDIPYTHGRVLFDAYLKPHLPPLDLPEGLNVVHESWEKFLAQREAWTVKRAEIVTTTVLPHFGIVEEFEIEGRKIVFLQTLAGAHDFLGIQEGVQDVIRNIGMMYTLSTLLDRKRDFPAPGAKQKVSDA
ncbi:hypothetical protein H0H93_006128 [Arthromyces matolae]|nr:hypothetical protein H0H93_006128 [Arthromyces matolae]